MAEVVDARILYWGVAGAGKSANLEFIHGRLRPDHRGDLERVPTPEDPSVYYERMPIELGKISGVRTRLQVVAPPGAPEQAATRQLLLDQVDGIVFVLDARREQVSANLAALEELRSQLSRYGRRLEDVPVVLQYNHRDQADDLSVEEIHRKIGMRAAAFEAIAPRGMGVLESLTTISKRVVRNRRQAAGLTMPPGSISQPPSEHPAPLAPPAGVVVDAESTLPEEHTLPEAETIPEAQTIPEESTLPEAEPPSDSAAQAIDLVSKRAERLFEENWDQATGGLAARTSDPGELELQIVAAGDPVLEDGCRLRIPLRLVDQDGRQGDCVLTLDLPRPQRD